MFEKSAKAIAEEILEMKQSLRDELRMLRAEAHHNILSLKRKTEREIELKKNEITGFLNKIKRVFWSFILRCATYIRALLRTKF